MSEKRLFLRILYLSIIFFSTFNLFAQTNKSEVPSFFGVAVGDKKSDAIDKLTSQGFAMMGDDDGNAIFVSRDGSAKFGENPVGAIAITHSGGQCLVIGLMFKNNQMSSIKYRKAVKDYIRKFSDFKVVAEDENHNGGGSGVYSAWIINQKYVVYSQEETGDTTTVSIMPREITAL